jgi:ABC-type transporter Mla subunit MlaD
VVEFLAPFLANTYTIFGIVGLLIVWSLISAAQLFWRTRRLIAILRQARSYIDSAPNPRTFAANFESTSRQLFGLGPLADLWSAYRETLIVPESDIPPRPLRSTLRPDVLFDLGLLRGAGLRLRYHAAMPGMLVGAGLLFTFFGLAVALLAAGDVVAGADQVQRQQGLHQLLNAASFKFFTSLAGLALSIGFTLFRNSRIRAVEQALDAFNAALERQMPLATPAFLQHESNEVLRKQSAALETFGTELALNIGQALDTAFDQRLGEHIGPLRQAMQSLADRISTQNQDAMQQMLQTFIERLSGGTREHFVGVTENLAVLGSRLEALQTGLGEASARMTQSAEAMATRMGEGAEAALSRMTDQLGGLLESMRHATAQTREAGAEAAQTLAERIDGAAAGFESAASRMAEQLAQAASGSGEAIARGAGEAAEGLQAAALGVSEMLDITGRALARQATALANSAEALAARIGELDRATREAVTPFAAGAADLRRTAEAAQAATAPLREVASSIGTAVEQIGNAAQRFAAAQAGAAKLSEDLTTAAQRFEGVDHSLAGTLTALGSGLDEFRRRIQEFVAGTDQNLAKAATQVSTMIRDLDETIEGLALSRA